MSCLGAGRPKKWKGLHHLTINVHDEYEEVWKWAGITAKSEGKDLSEFIEMCLIDARKMKGDGNPQSPLIHYMNEDYEKDKDMALRLKAKFRLRDLKILTSYLCSDKGTAPFRNEQKRKLERLVVVLSEDNVWLNNAEVREEVHKAIKVLGLEE